MLSKKEQIGFACNTTIRFQRKEQKKTPNAQTKHNFIYSGGIPLSSSCPIHTTKLGQFMAMLTP